MRVLLDTNIFIHREASHVVHEDIGTLFNWLDRLHLIKCIHPITINEISKHADRKLLNTMEAKLKSYHIIKTEAPINSQIQDLIDNYDTNENDINDSKLLNELINDRVDIFITEDRKIHNKANMLSISDRVFTIDSFLEKVVAENPRLVDYRILSVKKEYFGNIDLEDTFFDSFRDDYNKFNKWFSSKSDEYTYICRSGDQLIAFLYLKYEGLSENYSDITPTFSPKKRLKIGTFKITLNPFKLGERFLKIIFDNALNMKVNEIYVTIFPKRTGQLQLIELLKDWGFLRHGIKQTDSGIEEVYVRDFSQQFESANPKLTFPYASIDKNIFIVPIYPQYHTELFPDSILRTESPLDFIENEPHRNAIRKAYISRSIERNLKSGDIIVFYRTGGYYKGVATTIGVVENIITDIKDEKEFIRQCRKRSIFTDQQLVEHWNYNKRLRPFIVNFLYTYSFTKRPNLKKLIEIGLVRVVNSAPRGFELIDKNHFRILLKEAEVDESIIIN
ncbi:hypothetical protein JXO52_06225 [bacterium]|nr:hypothetical protein [bacterium]